MRLLCVRCGSKVPDWHCDCGGNAFRAVSLPPTGFWDQDAPAFLFGEMLRPVLPIVPDLEDQGQGRSMLPVRYMRARAKGRVRPHFSELSLLISPGAIQK